MAFVDHRFKLANITEDLLRGMVAPFGYNGFGEFIFYRTYSRTKEDDGQEDWADVVTRVTNGTFSIRKDWYIKNHISWNEGYWQEVARAFAISLYKMEWIPPGRGLWAMGSNFVFERGSMALYNCAYTDITTGQMADDVSWLMDSLMCGVGVGFGPIRDDKMELYTPRGTYDFVIPDTREGWADSERRLLASYLFPGQKKPKMIYDEVREAGLPIRGFGGVSSGPAPLKDLHERTIRECEIFKSRKEYDSIYFKGNIPNHVGVCVVAGNVRRSAELMKGKVNDPTFLDLKNYEKFPEREAFGWMSNNSVELETDEDFMMLGEIAKRVIRNGEPGYINRRNMPFARIGKKMRGMRKDRAVGFNPCGEIPLEHREVCNLSETLPTMCDSHAAWLNACRYATLYSTTVSLLPTHQPSTNRVVARNRRIGVGIIDYTGWKHRLGVHRVTQYMREGYNTVVDYGRSLNDEAGVPWPIRFTTIKPGGTTPKLAGRTSGVGHPTFDYTLRAVRVAKNSPVAKILIEAGVPYEEDIYDPMTNVFYWPILQGPAKPASKITLWEQAFNLITVQREWADNAVSNTLYFKPMWPLVEFVDADFKLRLEHHVGIMAANLIINDHSLKVFNVPERFKIRIKRDSAGEIQSLNIHEYDPNHEENDVEPVLSAIAPVTKSVSLLPHSANGAYAQMPESGISENEYFERLASIEKIDWTKLSGSDGHDDLYCTSDTCEVVYR